MKPTRAASGLLGSGSQFSVCGSDLLAQHDMNKMPNAGRMQQGCIDAHQPMATHNISQQISSNIMAGVASSHMHNLRYASKGLVALRLWFDLKKEHWVRKYFGNYFFFILGMGAEIFWELFFLFWELIFFLWFQLEETFQVGVGCPCRGGRPKKKQLEGGWGGGRSASPPDAFAEHAA